MRSLRMRALVALTLALLASPPAGGLAQRPAADEPQLTPAVAQVLAVPYAVLGADDRLHLPYELFLTNAAPDTMRLDSVQALDSDDPSRVLATLDGAALAAAYKPLVSNEGLTLGPAQLGRLFLDVTFDAGATLPRTLTHRFTVTLTSANGAPSQSSGVTGFTEVGQASAVVLDPPLAGARWVAAGGCCFPPSYHRTATLPVNGAFRAAQRFAIDFVQLDAEQRIVGGPLDQLASYPYFGAEIYAVADGVVVRRLDDLPEQTPPTLPSSITLAEADGNYVVLDIGNGRFAFFAHLQPGSVRVQVGDHVTRGQVLGLLGNTGNSSGPHLHFHVMDGPGPLTSNGLPYVFRSFDSDGTVTTSDADLADGQAATISSALAGPHRDQMPLQDQVVSFPARGAVVDPAIAAQAR